MARNLLIEFACHQWQVKQAAVEIQDGRVVDMPAAAPADMAISRKCRNCKVISAGHSLRHRADGGKGMEGDGHSGPTAAIANAVFRATGKSVQAVPVRL